MKPELLTTAQVAKRLGLSRRTLNRWVVAGRLHPAQQLPGLRGANLFDPSEVDRFEAELAEVSA